MEISINVDVPAKLDIETLCESARAAMVYDPRVDEVQFDFIMGVLDLIKTKATSNTHYAMYICDVPFALLPKDLNEAAVFDAASRHLKGVTKVKVGQECVHAWTGESHYVWRIEPVWI
jgi:hypothetical protein